jgi:hypothetical protein
MTSKAKKKKSIGLEFTFHKTEGGDLPWTIPDRNPRHSPFRNVIMAKKQVATSSTGIRGDAVAENIGSNPLAGYLSWKAYRRAAEAKDSVSIF